MTIAFLFSDQARYGLDQSRPSVKEKSGAVCVSCEGHAHSEPLPGGFLAGQPEEQRPEGESVHFFP